ncbi:siderophore synthetase component [Roseimicrobium gellanilyticum]|uniref:Siderophore synthetase component n=1 Tax=Roseimicrobium gellanilyticum TaxID=748857 RepID=A0A366HXH2_9BACT|nr:siderophore synthetase component [Roseimicrobium gellanilyticum]
MDTQHSLCLERLHDSVRFIPDEAEQRVIRQFVEALLFERLVDYKIRPRTAVGSGASDAEPIYGSQVDFPVGDLRFQCLATFSSYDRVRIAQGSVVRMVEGKPTPFRMAELLRAMEVPLAGKQRLLEELAQTIELHRWNRVHLDHHLHSRRTHGFQELESAIVEGHQYHPSFKTRTGFSLADHQSYGSETGNTFQLHFAAVNRELLRSALPGSEADFWKRELGDGTCEGLAGRLKELGGDFERFALVPIHPWQAKDLRERGFGEVLDSGDLIPLGAAGDFYHASQSLRTLVNATHPEKANIKLPLDIVCTSSRRNLEPHFVCTAPLLSKWIVSLVEEDRFLQDGNRLQLLSEYAAVSYEPEEDEDTAGLLGVIFRESIVGRLAEGETAIPFTALTLVESDGRAFIADWIKNYSAERWAERLIEVVVIPIWHMLVHHGIAFEAHAQNLILVHENGWPKRVVLRDFHEDTEFVPEFLGRPETEPDLTSVDPFFETIPLDDGYRMELVESLRQLYVDTVYVFNLADVSFLLERFHDFTETEFWKLVRAKLDAYAASEVTEASRIASLEADKPRIIVESLLTKTIHRGGTLDYYEHEVRNTLSREAP